MKAVVLTRYGSPQNLELQEIEEPVPKENEVKVTVHASSVNDWDWCITQGSPFYIRLFCGLIKPRIRALGVDIAGTVVAVGDRVTKFKVGDEVFGDLSECGFGGYAESCCASEQILTLKPKAISHLQAAALPHAAALALQGLQAGGTLGADTRLLINGAGGGVGTLGLQIARAMGVGFVAGVDHTSKLDMLRDLGFDKVIDYTSSDFTKEGQTYDLILDTKTNLSPFHYLKALSSTGKYVTVGGMTKRIIQLLVLGPLIRLFSRKSVQIIGLKTNQEMDYVNGLIVRGLLAPIIEGPFPLERIDQALERFGKSLHKGKLVIDVSGHSQ